jgi:hypothetical protein
MPTTRRPIGRGPSSPRITPAAIAAFRKLQQLEKSGVACTCEPIDWAGEYWKLKPTCAACQQQQQQLAELEAVIYDELNPRLKLWETFLENPAARSSSPYPEGSYADLHWKNHPDLGAQARWRALEEAARKESSSE